LGGAFAELLAYILELYLDIKFWFKKKKRRKFEKEHNLPKKLMFYPSDKIAIVFGVLLVVIGSVFMVFVYPNFTANKTKEKLTEIVQILEKEKKDLGVYPNALEDIIRNNPLRKQITKDHWNTNFWYKLSDDGTSYVLFSVGKDKTPKTADDISITNEIEK
jgi:general secretion pathway protein G